VSDRGVQHSLTGAEFQRKIRWLVFNAWNFPPIVGLGVIMLIGVLTPAQILGILVTPLEPAYIIGWLVFAVWFLPYQMRPLSDWLDDVPGSSHEKALAVVRRFPLLFWGVFLVYLIAAPFSVIWAAEIYTDFVARPVDFFRIELVALIVSIIVGLPIFFMMFDLFGRALGKLELKRPILTIRSKVFLIGALIPLLIDTMLVQYYWTRTGYFNLETIGMWAILEMLAIGGSLIFARSFGLSLAPLQVYSDAKHPLVQTNVAALKATSTDELGVLTGDYRRLLESLRAKNEIQELNNRLLRSTGAEMQVAGVFREIVYLCHSALRADIAFVMVLDPKTNELVGVIQSDDDYDPAGHFRLPLDATSLAVWCYRNQQTVAVNDCENDPRVSPEMREQFGVHAAIATPLQIDDSAGGVLMAISHGQLRQYGPYDISLIEGIANEAVNALKTQQLREERLLADYARREQEAQVRMLMDTTEEGIYGVDTEGRCTFINRAAVEMLGYQRPEDLIGRELHELIHHTWPDGRPYPKSECRVRVASVEGRMSHSDEEVHWRADGSSFPIEYWSRPIFREGERIGTVVSFVDITERKQAEEELRRYRDQLEHLVQQRTSELEELNRELEAFSYSVSHDLRAPLRAVDGFAQALGEDCGDHLDEAGQQYLERIRKSAQHMSTLIDDLLDLSRIGRVELNRIPVDMSSLAHDVVRQLSAAEPDREVDVEIAPSMVAHGDERLLRVLVSNLLENAWKYSGKTASPRIEFGFEEKPGETVYYVRDNGVGFDMRYSDKLFGAFQRLHGAEFPGTGIGLATVARVVHKHSGRVWAEGRIDGGATFYFVLSSGLPA